MIICYYVPQIIQWANLYDHSDGWCIAINHALHNLHEMGCIEHWHGFICISITRCVTLLSFWNSMVCLFVLVNTVQARRQVKNVHCYVHLQILVIMPQVLCLNPCRLNFTMSQVLERHQATIHFYRWLIGAKNLLRV